MKILKRIGKVLGVFAIIIIVYVAIVNIKCFFTPKNNQINDITDPTMVDMEEYEKFLASEQSDIEGMTKLDKYKKGLNPEDNADTDGDGLTDKEEIEKYGSDPTKKSTAGDLYEDGYKIKHNMDINQKYEYEGDYTFKWNSCDKEVMLMPVCADDFYAVVDDETETERISDNSTFYKAFCVYNYSGNVTFNLEALMKKTDKKASDFAIYYREFPDTKLSRAKTKEVDVTGNKSDKCITTKKKLDRQNTYMFYIMDKKSFIQNILFNDAISADTVSANYVNGSGIAYGSIISRFFGNSLNIWYSDLHVDKYTEKEKQALVDYVNTFSDDNLTVKSDALKLKSQTEIDKKYEFLHKYFSVFELKDPSKYDWYHAFFVFYKYNINNKNKEEKKKPKDNGFDEYVDELPFANFKTDAFTGTPHGNCAGFSHLTAKVFTGKAEKKGSWSYYDEPLVSWDLTKDAENKTLYNKGLYDYHDASYKKEHTSQDNKLFSVELSSADTEFKKMIECYWREGNITANIITFGRLRTAEHTNYSYHVIEEMMKALDNGHILDVYLTKPNMDGHAINITGYTKEQNGKYIKFKVYDCNLPQSLKPDGTTFNTVLTVKRVKSDYGYPDSFDFLYQPEPTNKKYVFTSYAKYGVTNYMFFVRDEDWNVIE